jgi:hypothetical protein
MSYLGAIMKKQGLVAEEYKLIAVVLEKAAVHYRVTAEHYFERNIPSACAHALA